MKVDVEVDARGQRCPQPVIGLARALAGLPAGGLVRLLATDPAARADVPAFCRLRGVDLVEVTEHVGAGVDEASPSGGHPAAGHTAYVVRQVSASTGAAARPGPS